MKPAKQPVTINFSQGLDTKTDPKQIQIGRFLSLQNSIFTKAGLLAKRNGFGGLAALPDANSTYLTTFGGNLTAVGNRIRAYSSGTTSWIDKGLFQPISFSQLPVVRSALNEVYGDSAVASNNLVCTAYVEITVAGGDDIKFVVQDKTTGQNIIAPQTINAGSGVVIGSPRVFVLGGYFVILFTNIIAGVAHIKYIAISINDPTSISAVTDLVPNYTNLSFSWDAVVVGNKLFVGYNTTSGGQQVAITYLSSTFVVAAATSFAGQIATRVSMTADESTPSAPIIYCTAQTAGDIYVMAVDQNLNKVMDPTQLVAAGGTIVNVTSTAQNGVCTVVYEIDNRYSFDANRQSNLLKMGTVTKPATVTTGTASFVATFVRSVGLASKGFLFDGTMYMLAAYADNGTTVAIQPTYYLINTGGQVIARIAYQNGGGYLVRGLPKAQVIDETVYIAYQFKDLVLPVNKSQGVSNFAGVYTQTGINLGSFVFSDDSLSSSELGGNLNMSGGLLYGYDGNTLSEQNFNYYPDMDTNLDGSGTSKALSVSHAGGSMATQDYFYVAVYEQTDAQGQIFRSAPSIPVPAAAASFAGAANSVTVNLPTYRLTYKSNVKIVVFRWSTAQQTYYQVTSISAPTLNSTIVDSVTFLDTQADSAIIGNSILYTTGGVLENLGTSAVTAITSFDTRLFAISAEDANVLLYSKTVNNATPIEMNADELSIYVAPNAGTAINTGPMHCLAPMDDKLIIFKENALYYINGSGPDLTGANSQYSQPIFITSTVGSTNQRSIVLTPNGLMFQSDKGIWLLRRDLVAEYKGAPVEAFNDFEINSATVIPATNQVRFTLSNGVQLMYDYFYDQWGTFVGAPAISSTIYQDRHTLINSRGAVSQETPGVYLDLGNPVLMQFTTGWLNLAGLQGYLRAFEFYLLGEYFTPHKVVTQMAYDYNPAIQQLTVITPTNASAAYGDLGPYGEGSPMGGPGSLEQWRVFLTKQRCQALQISIQEQFDATIGVPAGAGFTLSGITLVAGVKRGWTTVSAAQQVGGQQ